MSDFNWMDFEIIISILIIVIAAIMYFISLRKNKNDIKDIEDWIIEKGMEADKELDKLMYEDLEQVFGDEGIPNSLKNDLKNFPEILTKAYR